VVESTVPAASAGAAAERDRELRRHEEELRARDAQLAAERARFEQEARDREQRQKDEALEQQRQADAQAELRANQQKLEDDVRRLREEQRRREEEARQAKAEPVPVPPPQRAYTGPSSGEVVWEGVVKGTEIITIEGGRADSGTLRGALPGVAVLVQPTDAKKVSIASSPGPRNGFNRLVFRVSGNGNTRVVIKWSLP
jgi:hypothetical protein